MWGRGGTETRRTATFLKTEKKNGFWRIGHRLQHVRPATIPSFCRRGIDDVGGSSSELGTIVVPSSTTVAFDIVTAPHKFFGQGATF